MTLNAKIYSIKWNREHFNIGLKIGAVITLAAVFVQLRAELAAIMAVLIFGLAMQLGLEKNGSYGPLSVAVGIVIPAIILTVLAGIINGNFALFIYLTSGIVIAYLVAVLIQKLPDRQCG